VGHVLRAAGELTEHASFLFEHEVQVAMDVEIVHELRTGGGDAHAMLTPFAFVTLKSGREVSVDPSEKDVRGTGVAELIALKHQSHRP
jgi:hypothetical protein